MFLEIKRFLSCRMILSSSVPSSLDMLEVVQECAVMIGHPVKSVTLLGEAVEISLCTLGKSFMYGNCMCSGCKGSSRLRLLWVIRLAKRVFMLSMSLLLSLICCSMLKLSISSYVCVSCSCRLYSFVNQVVGSNAHPMFLSVCVMLMFLLFCRFCKSWERSRLY